MPGLCQYKGLLQKYASLLQYKSKEDLAQELKALEKPLYALVDEAARIRLSALHQEMQMIREEIDPNGWKRVCIAVMGPPMPREGELSMQYFEKILNIAASVKKCPYAKTPEGAAHQSGKQKLIYAESIYEEDKALDLISIHLCDEEVGKALLNDENAMRADILKSAAQKYLHYSSI